jgi:outer membrane protein insertion porin family
MMRLKIFTALSLLLWLTASHAEEFYIDRVDVNCLNKSGCESFQNLFYGVIGRHSSVEELRESFRTVIGGRAVRSAAFDLIKKSNNQHRLVVDIEIEQTIKSINFTSNLVVDFTEVFPFLPLSKGDWFDPNKVDQGKEEIKRFLLKRGYDQITVDLKHVGDQELELTFSVHIGKTIIVRDINYYFDSGGRDVRIYERFTHMKGRPWDQLRFKVAQETLMEDLFDQGFFFAKIGIRNSQIEQYPGDVKVEIYINRGARHNFYFDFNHDRTVERNEILGNIKEKIKTGVTSISDIDFVLFIETFYQKRGFYGTQVKHHIRKNLNLANGSYYNHYFDIIKGHRVLIQDVDFRGNYHISDAELDKIYNKASPVRAKRGFLDEQFLIKFSSILKRKYVERGFVFVSVLRPRILYSEDKNEAKVVFDISEGKRTTVKKISLPGLPSRFSRELLKDFKNKRGGALDITNLEDDFNRALYFVRAKGYYYASITNLDSPDLLKYSRDYSRASIEIELELGKLAEFNKLLIVGNKKTKDIVIKREVLLEKGEMITPDKIEQIRNRLIAISLFSKIKINPLVINRDTDDKNYHVNVVVHVQEKDYRELEISPGYRTDIGFKLSSAYSYSNIMGMDRSVVWRGQANQRVDFNNFDARRREAHKTLLEYRMEVEFAEPYLVPSLLGRGFDFKTSTVASRRRFYGFDGDIVQGSARIAKKVSDNTTLSLKYQLETINQYNATEEADSGFFRIGSITPAIMYDRRDDTINPRNGVFLSLSSEFANDWFWSLNRDDLEINYLKLVSRNKYYYQINTSWGVATQISGGFQKNIARDMITDDGGTYRTRGHIPSIKVFRLDGIDQVRGFTSGEINLIERDQLIDISKTRVDNEAYFANFKFELRNYLDDQTVLALFLDAGRVFVDTYRPFDLRSAVGVSLKFITPVGSMDFDYGFKTHRRRGSNRNKEQVGRFHLSIGFF